MYCRTHLIKSLGKDDLSMFAAWAVSVVYLALLMSTLSYGAGLHKDDQELSWLTPGLKLVLAIEIVYYIIVYLIKVSILLFYLRLGRQNHNFFRYSTLGTIVLLSVFLAVCLVVVFVQCIPLEKYWDPIGLGSRGTCIDSTAFFYSTSAFNIATDVWILVLPVKLVWGVHRPTREKAGLVGVFAMGVFACIASCIRLNVGIPLFYFLVKRRALMGVIDDQDFYAERGSVV